MATRRPLVSINGQIAEMPSGDVLAGDTYSGSGTKIVTFGIRGATTGDRVDTAIPLPFAGTILSWKLYSSVSTNAVITIKKNGSSIVASAKPTLTGATFAESSTLTGWTPAVAENDILMASVDSTDGQNLILQLVIQI